MLKDNKNISRSSLRKRNTGSSLEEVNISSNLKDSYLLESDEILKSLNTDSKKGLGEHEVKKRLDFYGYNVLKEKKKKNIFLKFIEQFSDFMVIILIIAAAVSFLVAVMQSDSEGFIDPVIIIIIVIINAVNGIIQEFKAEKAISSLKKMNCTEANVIRNGIQERIDSKELVPGDIIVLESGSLVPADSRILENMSVFADESSLTGESVPVEKNEKLKLKPSTPLGDRKNMLYMSSMVASGRCTAVVVETGMNTQVGRIADFLGREEESVTPLQEKLSKTGKILGITTILICTFIFIIGIIGKVNIFEMFMISVSLAVAAMPEGLPAVVTIVLALGVQKMAKKNAIIRKLSAVETLGSATVICSDKTGTLTQNKMTVTEIYDSDGNCYSKNFTADERCKNIILYSVLCNNSVEKENGKKISYTGDPTETALCSKGAECNINKSEADREYKRIREFPFDSTRKLMSVAVQKQNRKIMIITKGAPDILISKCTYYLKNGRKEILTQQKKNELMYYNNQMAKKALRVLSVAYKETEREFWSGKIADSESELIFCGHIGMIDPPRPEVYDAVKICRDAGIKPVMITGDHKVTAVAIAEEIGIYKKGDRAITGEEIDAISDEYFERDIFLYSVFARVSPEHKVKIVNAFKKRGNIVAMTGDGVNDAMSLKVADIGCAMGKNGTDVARASADMILVDDNFSTIVEAIRQGRGIYDNIKKVIHFLLSSNLGEILTIFSAFILKLPVPLLAIHLLWVNLITDSLPALALSSEKTADDIMNRPPLKTNKSVFADGLGFNIVFEGLMIGSLTLLSYIIGLKFFGHDLVSAQTMAFLTLSISQLVHSYNMRSRESIFKIGMFSNSKMNISFIICLSLQISVIIFKPLSAIFKTQNLSGSAWLVVAVLSLMPLFIIELQKFANKKN